MPPPRSESGQQDSKCRWPNAVAESPGLPGGLRCLTVTRVSVTLMVDNFGRSPRAT
jgi:hypothetical protein